MQALKQVENKQSENNKRIAQNTLMLYFKNVVNHGSILIYLTGCAKYAWY